MGLTVNQTYPVVDILSDVDTKNNLRVLPSSTELVDGWQIFGIPGALSRTSLHLPEDLGYDDWRRAGMVLKYMDEGVRWWLGDWWRFGERKYGAMASQEAKDSLKDETGHSYESIRKYAWVADKFSENGTRVPNLPWTYHRTVAHLDTSEERGAWLELAGTNEWSDRELRDQLEAAGKTTGQLMVQSDNNEWYTPKGYMDSVHEVMGGIDLDPASNPEANKIVGATTIYTIDDDGLSQQWSGRVFLNPPYGRLAGDFVTRLANECDAGNVTQAIALVNAHCTDTHWFQHLWGGVLCFTDHRIDFYRPDSKTHNQSTHGSVFAYFGKHEEHFAAVFSEYGEIVRRWPQW